DLEPNVTAELTLDIAPDLLRGDAHANETVQDIVAVQPLGRTDLQMQAARVAARSFTIQLTALHHQALDAFARAVVRTRAADQSTTDDQHVRRVRRHASSGAC